MATKACWGIDVGQCALKAIKLRQSGGEVEAVSFDVIEHAKILSQPDADEQQLIRNALDKFLSRNDVKSDIIVVGVPGQASFSRFIKLPPVELRKVPEIVKYEARQQIPFNLDEVIWDYQTLTMPTGGPAEIEVGIFAMKRDIVQDYVNDFTQVRVTPDLVQMGPVALYNFLRFDRHDGAGATLLVDIGAENTSLVIADGYRVWIRNFPLGGNNFTQALVKSFKLTFGKAENLKRHAAESKYAREVFQAMRPVFSDLLTEVQRSIGFYTSLHRESRIERVLAMGNTFRLPGLQKFLSQNLGVEVMKIERFNSLHGDAVTGAPMFKENVLSFGVAYGLALQGLGLGAITTTLLPPEILKAKELKRKRPFVAAAALAVVVGFGLLAYGSLQAKNALLDVQGETLGSMDKPAKNGTLSKVATFQDENNRYRSDFETAKQALAAKQKDIDAYMKLVDVVPEYLDAFTGNQQYRAMWYRVLTDVWATLPKDPNLLTYDPEADTPSWQSLQVVEVLRISAEYREALAAEATAPAASSRPGPMGMQLQQRGTPILLVTLEGTIPNPGGMGPTRLDQLLTGPLKQCRWSADSPGGYFQDVHQIANAVYKTVQGYPYEPEKPKPKEEAAAAPDQPSSFDLTAPTPRTTRTTTRPTGPTTKKYEPPRIPWRGDDYWFQIQWHINLEHPDQPVVYNRRTDTGGEVWQGTEAPLTMPQQPGP